MHRKKEGKEPVQSIAKKPESEEKKRGGSRDGCTRERHRFAAWGREPGNGERKGTKGEYENAPLDSGGNRRGKGEMERSSLYAPPSPKKEKGNPRSPDRLKKGGIEKRPALSTTE